MGVDQFNRFFQVLDADTAQHRAKYLFLVDAHVGRDMVKQRPTHPEAGLATLTSVFAGEGTAIDQQFGAFFNTQVDVAGDAFVRRAGDDRAHFGVEVHTVFDHQRFGSGGQHWQQAFGHITDQDSNRNRHAALASRTVTRANQGVYRLFEVSIRHDNHVVFGTAQGLHALAMVRARFVNIVGNRCRTDKGHGLDIRVHQ